MDESTSQAGAHRNPLVGQRIGSYRVLDVLGSGGMSTVFHAVHIETGHEVALKVLLGSLSRSSTLLQRFLREARSAETLEHPNIVTIYDRGVDQGKHYLVLEYVAGGDFHEYVQRNGPLGVAEAIEVIRGVVGGLRYAAGRGLIHRDIKPSNLLRTPRGVAKIIDLGLALQSEFEDERVTREGTTVGTVDYMSPEQARDSRATSIQSDMYSLGCAFYYMLAGIPPFPGGDITEKLTRHARAPAPDIRDLRTDIPPAVSAVLRRMMAKQPEDRFGDYDELIAALDAAGQGGGRDDSTIALAPLDDERTPPAPARGGPPPFAATTRVDPDDSEIEPMLLEPLDDLSFELADDRIRDERRPVATGPEPPLPRLGVEEGGEDVYADDDEEPIEDADAMPMAAAAGPAIPRWLVHTAMAAGCAVLLVIGLHLVLGGPRGPDLTEVAVPEPDRDAGTYRPGGGPGRSGAGPASTPRDRDDRWARRPPTPPERPAAPPRPSWTEPADVEPVAGVLAPLPAEIQSRRGHLPEWTRTPPRVDEPVVIVRRFPDATDVAVQPTLNLALQQSGGTVELADDGPLPVDDLYISGESRVIRARHGYRPIIRFVRSRRDAAQQQSAYVDLARRSLVLEGVDLILDARDLTGRQKALFGCMGSDLTLRDCTITVLNPTGAPFALIRQEPLPAKDPRRTSRIWLERTLVRGSGLTLAELAGGPVDLVLDATAVVAGADAKAVAAAADKGQVVSLPLVRAWRSEGSDEQRIFLAGSLLACPGPLIRCERPEGAAAPARPLAVRADASAVGQLQGPGVPSLVTSTDERAAPDRQVAWGGDANVFAGWGAFFARGAGNTVAVRGLEEARSTWSATEQGSLWLPLDWPMAVDPARVIPSQMALLWAVRPSLLVGPARPVAGLFPKTFDVYPTPLVPDPPMMSRRETTGPAAARTAGPRMTTRADSEPGAARAAPGKYPARNAEGELLLHTDDPEWRGDLGAFLRGAIAPDARWARVLVVGSGAHRFTPVQLPPGLALELRVEPDQSGGGLPSWSPDPQSSGAGLIELHGGALTLSDLILRHDQPAGPEALLAVEDAHLVLVRCQLTVPPDSGVTAADMIAFRAPTTRPMPDAAGVSAFGMPIGMPVCRLIDTVLIGRRTAVRAELGRGLIAMTRCAVASDETAIELDFGRVARRSFDADLWLDGCTLVAGRSIVGLGHWPKVQPGPERPWRVHSRRSLFLTMSEARPREGVLIRADADAYAGGGLFWQADGDVFDLGRVVSCGKHPTTSLRERNDLRFEWDQLWSSNHATRTAGPRVDALHGPRRRLRPGRIEPADLARGGLFPSRGASLSVGADLPNLLDPTRAGGPAVRPDR